MKCKNKCTKVDVFFLFFGKHIKILLSNIIICILFSHCESLSSVGGGCDDLVSNDDTDNAIIFDGYVYQYKKIPIFEHDSCKISYYNGQIVVVDNKDGSVVYRYNTNYVPGCEGMPAVSLLAVNMKKIKYSSDKNEGKFVIFCGNTGGPHNTIRVFAPKFGDVAALDFIRGPANLNIASDGDYIAIVLNEFWLKSLNLRVLYNVLYRAKSDNWPIFSFCRKNDDVSNERYIEFASRDYDIFVKDCEKFIEYGISAVIYYATVGDKNMINIIYKKIDGVTGGKASLIFSELNVEFGFGLKVEE